MDRTRDSILREAVMERLLNNKATTDAGIEVISLGQQITLRGVVGSPDVKRMAEQEAKAVPGVHQVINELEIQREEEEGGIELPPMFPPRVQ